MPYEFKTDVTSRRKLGLVRRCLPVGSAIDFGGMWEVDGYYSKQCLEFGIKKVTMVDSFESKNWKGDPSLRDGIDFRKGDFSDEKFMRTITRSYDLAMAYDIILHQVNFRHTLSLLLSKTRRFFLVANPVLLDSAMPYRNALVLLSGSGSANLIPFNQKWTKDIDYWRNFDDASNVKRNHWIWGMTPSSIESLMAGLGWRLVHREVWEDPFLQNPKWRMGGFVFSKNASDKKGRA
jgi:hypothetical protein